jgi:predicted dithiol-disulfide oxidoreductase (DUF899 family)
MNTQQPDDSIVDHRVETPDRWLAARKTLLAREKELTHLRDEVARERRALPWERVRKDYVFDTSRGPRTLAELFEGRSQLVVQHFMLGPGWKQGCPSCSFMADHTDGADVHLKQRDVTFVAVSRGTLAEIERFKQRMGWRFAWVSSSGNDFNFDFNVSFTKEELARGEACYNYKMQPDLGEEMPGISVFFKDGAGQVFHTYSTFGRGVELMMGTYDFLDIVPKGRDEAPGQGMSWVRHHDRYATPPVERGAASPAGAGDHGQA